MCVVAAAEELVCGAERPMDEEDAAAPVGGDRGRGPGDLESPGSLRREAGGPGRRLRGQRRGLALRALGFFPQDPPRLSEGPGETGRHTGESGPVTPRSVRVTRPHPGWGRGPVRPSLCDA